MNLLLIGAPGTGKGTMSGLLQSNYGLVHISTGDILRESIKEGSPVGLKAQAYMQKGQLVPDEIIHDIIVERLSKDDIKKGFLMDGYPRNVEQAKDFDNIMKEVGLDIDLVIVMEIDEEILKNRITGRRICKNCGEIYHTETRPSKVDGVCDVCGGELYARKDDNLDSLKVRLHEYHEATQPTIDYYESQGLIKRVDASKAKDEVYSDIVALLEKKCD